MPHSLEVMAEALAWFRRDLGIRANPEDAPAVWDRYLADVQDALTSYDP